MGTARAIALAGIALVVVVFVLAIFNLVLSSLKAMRWDPISAPLGFAFGFTVLVLLLLVFLALLLVVYDALGAVGDAGKAARGYWY